MEYLSTFAKQRTGRKQKSKVGPQINPIGMINSSSKRNQPKSQNQIVFQPTAIATKRKAKAPRINYASNGSCRVSHREYLQDVLSSNAFTTTKYHVNPGLKESFPWLSALANRFESYLFHKLRFEFCTEAATTEIGTVLLTLDYDPLDPAPLDKTQALAYADAVRSPPWSDCVFIASSKDLRKMKTYFTRSSHLDVVDLTTKDTGNLYVCTQGQTAVRTIGELWVEYEVELMTPQLQYSSTDYAYGVYKTTNVVDGVNTLMFGTIDKHVGGKPPGIWNAGTFTFHIPGNYFITLFIDFHTIVAVSDLNLTSSVNPIAYTTTLNDSSDLGAPVWGYSAVIVAVAGTTIRPMITPESNASGTDFAMWIFGSPVDMTEFYQGGI